MEIRKDLGGTEINEKFYPLMGMINASSGRAFLAI